MQWRCAPGVKNATVIGFFFFFHADLPSIIRFFFLPLGSSTLGGGVCREESVLISRDV